MCLLNGKRDHVEQSVEMLSIFGLVDPIFYSTHEPVVSTHGRSKLQHKN
jgi:hypothetical protein